LFLREAWKIKPQETETFLLKWKNTGARLIFQYACEKMTKVQKLKYRKENKLIMEYAEIKKGLHHANYLS